MSEGLLNDDELDALRAAVEQDDLPGEGDSESVILDGAELPRFRFGESRIGGPQREERLASVFGKAASELATRISDILESTVDVQVAWLEETRFGRFRENFDVDGRELATLQFHIPGLTAKGLVCFEPQVVERLVEGLMGGAAMADAPLPMRPERPVTELDLRVTRRWVTGFLHDLGRLWNPGNPLPLQVTAADSNGAAARTLPDTFQVIAGLFEINVGPDLAGMIGVVLPEGAADAMAAESVQGTGKATTRTNAHLRPAVPDFEVDLEVAVARHRLTVRELLALQVGDVVFLDPRQTTTGYVQGVPKFHGVPGALNGQKAVQISQVMGRSPAHAQ